MKDDPAGIADAIALLGEHAGVLYRSCFVLRMASRVYYFYHYLANKGLRILSNLCHKCQ